MPFCFLFFSFLPVLLLKLCIDSILVELRKEKQNKIKNCVLEEGNKGNDVVMVMKERDEELALFLEMRRREKEKTNLLLPLNSDNHNAPSGTVLFGLFIYYFDYFWLFWAYFGNSTKMSEVALTLTRNKRRRISDIKDCVVRSDTQDRCWKFLEFGEWKR